MSPRRSPQGIRNHHSFNQSSILRAIAGLPRRQPCGFDSRAQNLRNRSCCHRTTVSGWT
jgi:hypothetical protein